MKIYLSDWLTNAGIVGFIRIQEKKGIDYNLSNGYLEIKPKDLNKFADTYFVYTLLERINVFFPSKIFNRIYKGLEDNSQKTLQNNIRNLQDKYFEEFKPDWNSYNKTIKILKSKLNQLKDKIIEIVINTLPLKESKSQEFAKRIELIKRDMIEQIDKVTDKSAKYFPTLLHRFYFNKNVVCNPSFSGKSRVKSFEKEYVTPAQDILNAKTDFQQITCKVCKQNKVNIDSFDSSNSFFNEGMFSPIGISLSTFTNFFYNFQPDMVICDLCELLLLCTHAGFNQIPYEFRDEVNKTDHIFVNLPSLELLKEENNTIRNLYKHSRKDYLFSQDYQGSIIEHIIEDIFAQEKEKKSGWVIHNILFIEIRPTIKKREGKPVFRYFHIGRDIADLFLDKFAITSIKWLKGKITISKNTTFALRREAVRRILTYDSLYPLCYYILNQNPSIQLNNVKKVFNLALLSAIRNNIWEKTKESGNLSKSNVIYNILKQFQQEGEKFKENTTLEQRQQKSYRLLSLVRTGKITDFYDILIKLYMSENRPIPDRLISLLNKEDSIDFYAKAYAFLSGFLSENKDKKE